MSADTLPTADGRRARRDQNRERVVDALLDIYREGNLQPSVAQVAARSGVSHRSVFRYFEDLDELYRVAVARQYRAVTEFLMISDIGRGPLLDRIDDIVEKRLNLYDAVASVARVGHMLAPVEPVLNDHLCEMAELSVGQIGRHFAPELELLEDGDRTAASEAAALAVSMEAMELLRHIRGLDRIEAGAAMRATMRGLLSSAPVV